MTLCVHGDLVNTIATYSYFRANQKEENYTLLLFRSGQVGVHADFLQTRDEKSYTDKLAGQW